MLADSLCAELLLPDGAEEDREVDLLSTATSVRCGCCKGVVIVVVVGVVFVVDCGRSILPPEGTGDTPGPQGAARGAGAIATGGSSPDLPPGGGGGGNPVSPGG